MIKKHTKISLLWLSMVYGSLFGAEKQQIKRTSLSQMFQEHIKNYVFIPHSKREAGFFVAGTVGMGYLWALSSKSVPGYVKCILVAPPAGAVSQLALGLLGPKYCYRNTISGCIRDGVGTVNYRPMAPGEKDNPTSPTQQSPSNLSSSSSPNTENKGINESQVTRSSAASDASLDRGEKEDQATSVENNASAQPAVTMSIKEMREAGDKAVKDMQNNVDELAAQMGQLAQQLKQPPVPGAETGSRSWWSFW